MTPDAMKVQATAGLAVVIRLPASASDTEIALSALQFGLAPDPLFCEMDGMGVMLPRN